MLEPHQLFPIGAGQPTRNLIDVRAPKEVAQGSLPYSSFQPILTDAERHQVGIRYKKAGQEAATALGYELTDADMPRRIEVWRGLANEDLAAVMCWRGGLRSKLAQEFADVPDLERVAGGYKAVRNYLLEQLTPSLERKRTFVLSGLTGTGKTEVLCGLNLKNVQALDLEAAANHRGSAFGVRGEQPSQQTFENDLMVQLILSPATVLVLEDESHRIGGLFLPKPVWREVRRSEVVWLEAPLKERVGRIFDEYVREPTEQTGLTAVFEALSANLEKLRQRLGNAGVEDCLASLETARADWFNCDAHAPWIRVLLTDYYDPLYKKGVAKLDRPVAFRGDAAACKAFLAKRAQSLGLELTTDY